MGADQAYVDLLGQAADAGARAIARTGRPAAASRAEAREAAVEFEAVFLAQMLAPMFENLDTDGLFGGGSSERMYRSLLVQEYGKSLARSGGVGVADIVQREMLKLQEVIE